MHAHHDWTAPHSTTTDATTPPPPPPPAHTASADCPHSPDALAAAVTLATLSDSNPSTSYGDHDDDEDHDGAPEEEVDDDEDDDDDSGGISLVDYHDFMEAMPSSHDTDGDQDRVRKH